MPVLAAPTLTATATNTGIATVSLVWTNVVGNTGYTISMSPGSLINLSSNVVSYLTPTLSSGSTYSFQVATLNASGLGSYSTAKTAIPYVAPSAVASFSVNPSNLSNVLVWTATSNNGGNAVTGYKWFRSTVPDMSVVDLSFAVGNVLTSIDNKTPPAIVNGTTYYYYIRASNAAGLGISSQIVSSTPRTIPGTSSISVTSGTIPSSFNLSFSATNGGSSNAYIITPYSNAVAQPTMTVSGSPITYNGSFGVSYTFSVRASNAAGFGTASAITTPATPNYLSAGALPNPTGNTYWFYPPTTVAAGVVAYNLPYADVSISQLSNAAWSISYGGASDTLNYVRRITLADRSVWLMDASYSTTGGSYLTIATNNASLSNGDVLRVGSGVYLAATQPTVNKSITIEGPPDGSAVFGVAPGVGTWCLTVATDNVVVRNLTLDTCYALSTAVRGDFSLLIASAVSTVSGVPLVARELSNIIVENMQFKNSYTKSGVASSFNRWENRRGVAVNSVSGLILRNCTFPKTWMFGLTLASCRNIVVTGNTFYACPVGSVNVTTTTQLMLRYILSNDQSEYETSNIDLTSNTFLEFGDPSVTTIVPTPTVSGTTNIAVLQKPTITIQPGAFTISSSSVRLPPEYAFSYTLSSNVYFGQNATDLPPTFWPDATAVTVMSNSTRVFPPGYASAANLTPSLVSVGDYVQGSVAVTVSSAMPYVTYAFSLDGSLAGSNTTGVYIFKELSEGVHSVAVTAFDGYLTSPATILSFVSDTILPTISGFTLVTGPNLSGEITVTFDASDANGPLSYTTFLNDMSYGSGTSSPDTIELPGWNSYDVKVKVTDAAGNVGTSSSLTVEYWPTPSDDVNLSEGQTEQNLNIGGDTVTVDVITPADIENGTSAAPASGDLVVIRQDDGTATPAIYSPDVPADIEAAVADALAVGVDTILIGLEDSQGVVTLEEATYTEADSVESSNDGVTIYADTSQVNGWLSTPPSVDPATGDVYLYYRVLDDNRNIISDGFSVPLWITKPNVVGPSIAIWHRDDAATVFEYLSAAMRVAGSASTTVVAAGSDVFYYELTVNNQLNAMNPTVPDAPTNVAASSITSTSVLLSWSAPAYDGGAAITGYDIMNGAYILDTVTTAYATVTGLGPSTPYTLGVRAVNAIGESTTADVQFTTPGPVSITSGPTYSEPRTLTIVAAGSGITYQWKKNGVALSDNAQFSGSATNQLKMTGNRNVFIGNYTVVVTDSNDLTATSSAYSITSATGSADPYISTLDGKLYKLPSFNGHIRLYQGEVGGKLLTVNATTKIDDDKTAMDADTAAMNSRLAKPVQRDLQMMEAMSFFERFHIDYAGETTVVNVYDGFKVEKAASWPVEVVGNVQKFLKAFPFYEHLAGDIVEISPCPEVVLRIGIVPIRSIRNSIEIIAPNMAAGNGVFVHRMTQKAMTLRKLSDVKPVEKKDAAVKRTLREAFVCDAKTATVNIPYVG